MRRTSNDHPFVRPGKNADQVHGVTRLDRETLEEAMREDVFLAADGKALAQHPPEMWTQARRGTRRA
jgi:hypothetical protein